MNRFLMGLVIAALAMAQTATAETPRKKVAILIFDGAEVIDYAGPYQVFEDTSLFDLYTVAPTDAPVTTGVGLKLVPNYSIATAPQADVLIIPGGDVAKVSHDDAVLTWIKAQSARTQVTMSVCNGAFTLANTGALAGLSATTTRGNIERLRKEHPEITVVRDQRFTDNGHYVTAGGLSAGIDAALHVLRRLAGPGAAQMMTLYMEYKPNGERDFLPGTFAASAIPWPDHEAMTKLGDWSIVSTEGDTTHWTQVAELRAHVADQAALRRQLEDLYAVAGKWRRIDGADNRWSFVDGEGQNWTSTLVLEQAQGSARTFRLTVSVKRDA
jgi:putative intracellular protease/amidase